MKESKWLRAFRLWSNGDRDVDDEFAFHFRMRVEQYMEQGYSREAAERAARDRFGDVDDVRARLVTLDTRRRRRLDLRERIDGLLHDFVVSARSLRREPLFATGAVLTLALGIGANATMFGVIDRLMLRGPAYVVNASEVNQIFISHKARSGNTITSATINYASYTALRDNAHSFAAVAAYAAPSTGLYGSGSEARPIREAFATWDLFPLLGVHPLVGRFFTRAEDVPPHGASVAVISEEMWQRDMGGAADVIGKRITVSNQSYTIIGVAPRGFTGPQRLRADVWLPMSTQAPTPDWPTTWRATWLNVEARLAPGVTRERAGDEATRILRGAYTGKNETLSQLVAAVHPLSYDDSGVPSAVVNVSRWLMGVAVIVLLVTCANVANLLVARARRRRREVAVRLALGAGRWRLVQLLLAESLVIVVAGMAAALVLTVAGSRLMRVTLLASVAWDGQAVDARVFVFTAAIGVVTCALVSLAPALEATRVTLTGALQEGIGAGGGRRGRGRMLMTALQAAMCVVLLVGAGLFTRSLARARSVNLGFEAGRVIRADPSFPFENLRGPARDEGKRRATQTMQSVVQRLAALPWVEHAALTIGSPFGFGFGVRVRVPGLDSLPALPGGGPYITAVTADYFAAVGTPLRSGRVFTSADRDGSTPVAIVNETMARTLWPGQSPLGKCLLIGESDSVPCASIVGVVSDVHRMGLREPASMQYYIPFGQERDFGGTSLLVRPRGDAESAIPQLKKTLIAMPDMPYTRAELIQAAIDPSYRPWQLGAAMFGVFGILALIIAAVGLYSVIAYLVADRTRELGVRIALGASSGRIVREVVSGGAGIVSIGIAAGLGTALAAGRFVEPLLFDETPRDPTVIIVVAAIVFAIGVFAAWWPARRASRVDPMVALRYD
jgi:predicted permease